MTESVHCFVKKSYMYTLNPEICSSKICLEILPIFRLLVEIQVRFSGLLCKTVRVVLGIPFILNVCLHAWQSTMLAVIIHLSQHFQDQECGKFLRILLRSHHTKVLSIFPQCLTFCRPHTAAMGMKNSELKGNHNLKINYQFNSSVNKRKQVSVTITTCKLTIRHIIFLKENNK